MRRLLAAIIAAPCRSFGLCAPFDTPSCVKREASAQRGAIAGCPFASYSSLACRRFRTASAVAIPVLAAIVAYYISTANVAKPPDNGGLTVPPTALDFGEVRAQREFVWTFPIQNNTSQEVSVRHMVPSCRCARIAPLQFTLAPGAVKDVRLVIDLSPRNEFEMKPRLRDVDIEVWPILAGHSRRSHGWRFIGTVKNTFMPSPELVRFPYGAVVIGNGAAESVDVHCHEPLDVFAARCDTDLAEVSIRAGDGQRHFRVTVNTHATMGLGRHSFSVFLSGTTPDGETVPEVPVPVYATVVEDVEAVPPVVFVGALSRGHTAKATIRLRSRTGTSFTVQKASCRDPGVKIELGGPLDPGAYRTIAVNASATEHAYDERIIAVVVRSAGIMPTEYVVPVRVISQATQFPRATKPKKSRMKDALEAPT